MHDTTTGADAPPRPAIEVRGLRKAYGGQVVLDGVDLAVAAGTVVALLGPNGAGKTTAVQVLSTLIPPDGGEVRVAGHDLATDPDGIRRSIGVTGQFSAVDDLLTGRENLQLIADLLHLGRDEGRRRVAELLERFDLVDAADRAPATYSGGMRRKLDLAMTLVGDPQVIFLDEPTTGLAPRTRRAMWQAVRDLVAGGVSVLLTTQYLEEADHLADRIALLDRGAIVAEGTAEELKRLVPGGHIRLRFADVAHLEAADRAIAGATRDDDALALDVPSDGDLRSLRGLLDHADRAGLEVESLSVHSPALDDVFLALTGRHTDTRPDGTGPADDNDDAAAAADATPTVEASR
jgi:ABC-2 type transport system ATP-binding protein